VRGITARMIDLVRNQSKLATEAEVKAMIAAALDDLPTGGGGMTEAQVRQVIIDALANG